jgi:ATP-dependent helicase HrpA
MELMFETAAVLVQIVEAQRLAQRSISEVSGLDYLPVLTVEKQHLGELLQPNLVSAVGLDRLPRLLVYLRAIGLRITKLAENPNRDRLASYEFEQALQTFTNAGGRLPLPETAEPKLVAARWLLEELRVSLFAQTLGTVETVSVQRIKKLLA